MTMKQKGFSLLEVLIGVAILTGMSLLLYSSMNRSLSAKAAVDARDEVLQGARVAIARIADDLSQAVLANKAFASADGNFVTGLKGAGDQVDFSALGHFHFLKNARDSDSTNIGYYLKSGSQSGLQTLMRRENATPSDKIDEGGIAYPVIENVKNFGLEYYDAAKAEWVTEWTRRS
jgi:type II secretion system protein J